MQLYITTLNLFACFWHKSERVWKWLLIALGYRGLVDALSSYKEKDMLKRMNELSGYIESCTTFRQLQGCKDLFLTWLMIPYPEYTSLYYLPITKAIENKEQQLKAINN